MPFSHAFLRYGILRQDYRVRSRRLILLVLAYFKQISKIPLSSVAFQVGSLGHPNGR